MATLNPQWEILFRLAQAVEDLGYGAMDGEERERAETIADALVRIANGDIVETFQTHEEWWAATEAAQESLPTSEAF